MEVKVYLLAAVLVINIVILIHLFSLVGIVTKNAENSSVAVGYSGVNGVHEATLLRIQSMVERSTDKSVSTTTAAVPSTINNAPVLPIDSSACGSTKLFGKEHQGGKRHRFTVTEYDVLLYPVFSGWLACNDAAFNEIVKSKKCIVYSFGLGFDWSFDSALERLGCELHGFDPSGESMFAR
jgi:hypothetical protein